MIILGIESATNQVGCALGGQEGVLASFHAAKGRRHAETLVPAIQFICKQTRIDLEEVRVVAVDLGPGLFTGLRVGVATAKAIAHALKVPMIGITSLDLLAFPVRFTSRLIVPVVDARKGEVFYAYYRQVAGGVQRLGDLQIGSPEQLAGELMARNEDALLIGDGAHRYEDRFAELSGVEIGSKGHAYPSAGSLVELAQPQALREQWIHPWELEPIYLRKADAEINWQRRAPQAGDVESV